MVAYLLALSPMKSYLSAQGNTFYYFDLYSEDVKNLAFFFVKHNLLIIYFAHYDSSINFVYAEVDI